MLPGRVVPLRREDLVQLTSIYSPDERRDFDEYFDHDDENFDHDFDDKGGLFSMM